MGPLGTATMASHMQTLPSPASGPHAARSCARHQQQMTCKHWIRCRAGRERPACPALARTEAPHRHRRHCDAKQQSPGVSSLAKRRLTLRIVVAGTSPLACIHGPYPWKRSIVSGCAAHRPPTAFVRELWRNALQPDLAPSHATESFGGSSFSFSPTKKTRGPPTTPATMAVADLLPLSWCRHPAVIVHLRHAACWVARGSPAVILSAGAVAVADSASKPRRIRRRGRRRRE